MSELDTFGALDDPRWQVETDYSAAIAALLRQTALILAPQGMPDRARRDALDRLRQSLTHPMAAHQRQRVLYLLGRAAAARSHQDAIGHFETALQLALDLDDYAATAESAFALARAHTAFQRFGASASALEVCIIALTAAGGLEDDAPLSLVAQAVEAMLALATSEYVRGHFDATEHWLVQADTLIPRLPRSLPAAGIAAANRALLARARGQFEVALRHALVALDIAELCHEASLRWARGLVVEAALDLAEVLPGGPLGVAGRAILALAHASVDDPPRMPQPARAHPDVAMSLADGVAYLASVRYQRLAGSADTSERLAAIEHVLAHAERHGNNALLGLAFSALGDDLAARGVQTPALRAYEAALEAIAGQDMAAIGLRARRALLHHREQHPEG
jgi:hypothetical protein